MRKMVQTESGFSLLETTVALLVLTIGLLGLAQLLALAASQGSFARYNSSSITAAQAKLEQLRSAYNWELESGALASDLVAGNHGPEAVALEAPDYSNQGTQQLLVSWQVTDLPSRQKSVNITVESTYQNHMQNKTMSLTSHFAP